MASKTKSVVVKNPTLKALMFSSACERWKNKYGVRLVNYGSGPASIEPLPFDRAARVLSGASNYRPERDYVARCVHRQHVNANSAHAKQLSLLPAMIGASAIANDNDQRDVDVAINFDEDELTTEVIVTSVFPGVKKQTAIDLLEAARPFRWAEDQSFFKQSVPIDKIAGILSDQSVGSQLRPIEFDPTDTASYLELEQDSYHLLEHVEWNWTPEIVGGLVNVLEITPSNDLSVLKASIEAAVQTLADSSQDQKQLLRSNVEGLVGQSTDLMRIYKYDLVQSLQSKFTSSWEPGGLEVDGGEFAAGWFKKGGKLFIRASKRLRYSAEAEASLGAPRLLNLIAPAVVSMLMRNLVYDGVIEALAKAQD